MYLFRAFRTCIHASKCLLEGKIGFRNIFILLHLPQQLFQSIHSMYELCVTKVYSEILCFEKPKSRKARMKNIVQFF